ncbi:MULTISPECIES: ribbon-helix-helix domain-containing protein [Clostridia]|uniref:ribbon-helix-helix domain-containing protein n=1 Tax=Clostridia TaxID=186801 RepID=UPI002A850464|nr:ribbon-helix-helix domain-containing protein [Peptostreptococcus porci]MDY5098747.1 ribbon-helix-helix domain-containing protein [Clostridium sp.]MDY5437523.1 ribbon-helix-helix domain-containing protein [Peptostreptococcus porci]
MTIQRKRFTFIASTDLLERIDKLSKESRLTKTVLFDEALEDLLKKYEKKIELYKK